MKWTKGRTEFYNKYPKSYDCLQNLISTTKINKIKYVPMYYFWERKTVSWEVPSDDEEREGRLQEYLCNIKEPIWSLCELLLDGGYDKFYQDKSSNHIITVKDINFVFGFNGFNENCTLSPQITEGQYEYDLLNRVLYGVVLWETQGRVRKELKDKLCGGDKNDF